MSAAKSLSLFGVALATVLYSSGAIADGRYGDRQEGGYGGYGGYTLNCRSVSPTYGCSPEQREINFLTFDLEQSLQSFSALNQDVASGAIALSPRQTERLVGAETNYIDSIDSLLSRL